MAMASSKTHDFLTCLLIFNNTSNPGRELMRSLHVYRLKDGEENEVEREFVLSGEGDGIACVEMATVDHPLGIGVGVSVSEVFEGLVINGLWVCIFAFHAHHTSTSIPSLLTISRNPKLRSIPALANDLETIFQLMCTRDEIEEEAAAASQVLVLAELAGTCSNQSLNNIINQPRRTSPPPPPPVLHQDLNCLPYPLITIQQIEQTCSSVAGTNNSMEKEKEKEKEMKKKRAGSKDIASIGLSDVAKYFDVPIVEASRNLKVGLTVLKRKCREFGIPRWPHRKIKSLDTLIRDLQEERKCQQQQNKSAAAIAVAKRQKMLENEKESIERKPFLQMKTETKRFRQHVFKTRHRARAHP